MSTIFKRIVDGDAPARIVYQDETVTAFWDKYPQAPVHVLIVPNRVIASVNDLTPEDEVLVGHMVLVAKQVAQEHGVAGSGYRLIINCGRGGGQSIFHMHMHLLGGRPLGPLVRPR
jgi:histidine triad (HIT) family protein